MNQTIRFNEKIYDIERVELESNDYEDRDVLKIFLVKNFKDEINEQLRPLIIKTLYEHGESLAKVLNLNIDQIYRIDGSGYIV